MSFASPVWLFGLLVVPALLGFVAAVGRRPPRNAIVFTNVEVLAAVAPAKRSWRRFVAVGLLALALASAAAATARPQARFTTVDRRSNVILLVDVSGSMSARDVEPTRLDAAAAAMRGFLDRLPESVDVGLVQFSLVPEVLERPTADRSLVHESLRYLFPEAGTAIGDALARTVPLVRGRGAIVLLSDGTQNHGRLSPLAGAELARARGIRIDTIALGTPQGALIEGGHYDPVPPDPPLMRAIARATGGRTFTARSAEALGGIYSHLGRTLARTTTTRQIGSWFAFGAALLLAAAVAAGRRWGSSLL